MLTFSKGTTATTTRSSSSSFIASAGRLDSLSTRRRIIQNFRLIWLDSNIDKSDDGFQNPITHLRRIVNTIDTFNDPDQCITFLTKIKDENALMIVSGTLGQYILPLIHDMSQLNSVYVFEDKSRYEQWAKDWSKVKGVSTEIATICDLVKRAVRQCDQNSIPISFAPLSDTSNQNLDRLDQSFMYTQLLKEILLEIKYEEEESIKELATYCRDKHTNDDYEALNKIDKFEQEYRLQSPIWWYTSECFLYSMLNRALRIQEVDTIIKMGVFVRDLHRHIQQLHLEQTDNHQPPFTVYRGQGLSEEEFQRLAKRKGGLMSFNNFLSTSTDRDVSYAFAESNADNLNLVGILFTIAINPSISSAPFALLDHVTYYESEKEILFSMHTVFRIAEIEQIDNNNRLWQVNLALTSDDDQQLSALTKRIREETTGSAGWEQLGQLLITLNEFEKAEEVYLVLFDQTSENVKKAYLCHQLGRIKSSQGDHVEALSFLEKSLEIRQKSLPPDHPDLAISYNSIGGVYKHMGEYSKALSFMKKSLEIRQKSLPPDHLDLAISYNNIGWVYESMGENSKALSVYKNSLEIKQRSLPSNHPGLATSYNNIGKVYENMGEYAKALSFLEQSLGIDQESLPQNHHGLATSYSNVGGVYKRMGEYSKALSFMEISLEIRQKSLPPNHPDLAISYNEIGCVYDSMGENSKALSFHENSLEIKQKSIHPNHSSLATSYDNIGKVYENMGENAKALSFYKKSLEIRQKSLPPNHLDLVISYNNIGAVYDKMGEQLKAVVS